VAVLVTRYWLESALRDPNRRNLRDVFLYTYPINAIAVGICFNRGHENAADVTLLSFHLSRARAPAFHLPDWC
jgi:hypothetical protein